MATIKGPHLYKGSTLKCCVPGCSTLLQVSKTKKSESNSRIETCKQVEAKTARQKLDNHKPIAFRKLEDDASEKLSTHSEKNANKQVSVSRRKKPEVLVHIEKYVERELAIRIHPESPLYAPHELEMKQMQLDTRLEVYREAANMFTRSISTFTGLVGDIINTYEESLKIRDERIGEMMGLKRRIVNLHTDMESKIETFKLQFTEEKQNLINSRSQLLKDIDTMRVEKRELKATIDKLQEELVCNHERYLDEIDAKQLIMKDMAQIRQQLEMMRTMNPAKKGTEDQEDPVLLRVALTRCREDLARATASLNEMKANYTDVVPQRDLEALREAQKRTTKQNKKLVSNFEKLQKKHEKLEEANKALKDECNKLTKQVKILKRSGTPRPKWVKCAEYVKGGIVRWSELMANKSSEQCLEILLMELCGGEGLAEEDDNFYGQGMDQSLPPYLRYEGTVQNRHLSRRDLSILITDIWNQRSTDRSELLPDFVAMYFAQRFHLPLMRAEWAYNMVAACERMLYDEQISTFWGTLTGQIQEDLYWAQQEEFETLKDALLARINQLNLQDSLPSVVFAEVAQQVFPDKSSFNIAAMVDNARAQLGAGPRGDINVTQLFTKSAEGMERGVFFREVAQQSRDEQDAFIKQILINLDAAFNKDKQLPYNVVQSALLAARPEQGPNQLESNIRWIYGENLKQAKPLGVKELTMKLQTCNIRQKPVK